MNDSASFPAAVKRWAAYALIVTAVVLLFLIGRYAAQRPPSFDGAMNLQVSYSLAHGEGYRRTYADRVPFPREVQTHSPYLLPAAAVFKLSGIGKLQAQLTNLIYLAGLSLASLLLLRKRFGLLAGATGAVAVLITPGVLEGGLNGYGEIPALFWAIAALLMFPWQASATRITWRVLAAGLFLGLAVSTKTALLICFAWFGLCFAIAIASDLKHSLSRRLILLTALLFASLVPTVLIESWRLVALGDWQAYQGWWLDESQAIGKQAGTASGYHDTAGIWEKLAAHFSLLSGMYGLNKVALALWLAIPPLLGLVLFSFKGNWRKHGVLFCLLGATAIYFAWWLLVTPTQKAWHRRILDGSLMLNLAWVYLAALSTAWLRDPLGRWVPAAACAALFWLSVQFFATDVRERLFERKESDSFDTAVQLLRSLPRDAQLYGIGWHSAPGLSLLSERYLQDFNDTLAVERDPSKPSYIVLDAPAIAANKQRLVASMYRMEPLLAPGGNAQVYRVYFDEPNPDAIRQARLATSSVIGMDDPRNSFSGFYRIESKGARWMSSQSIVGLRYDGSPYLSLSVYLPPRRLYMRREGLSLNAALDGCALDPIKVPHSVITLQFKIPSHCKPPLGKPVAVLLSTDNLLRSSITRDERALSMLVQKVGFSDACGSQEACDRLLSTPAYPISTSPTLTFAPELIDFCGSDRKTARINVSWHIPGSGSPSWKIWVSAPGSPRKLWVSGQGPGGTHETGDWVVDQTMFSLEGDDGRELARATISARTCP